jgi:hypothetical protein
MSEQGITVLRFSNAEVRDNLRDVLRRIQQTCDALVSSPSPPTPLPGVPGRGEPNPAGDE